MQLPEAFRSLSRPSSAPDAKAFPLRSSSLDLVDRNFTSFAFSSCLRIIQKLLRSVLSPLQVEPASLGFNLVEVCTSTSSCRSIHFWFLFKFYKNYAGSHFFVSLLAKLLFTLNFCFLTVAFSYRFSFTLCSVFKVHLRAFLLAGGPKGSRTTDLTIISRVL